MRGTISFAVVAGASVLLSAAPGIAQTKAKAPAAKAWTQGQKTPDGQPDIQGIWANNNITPMERPKAWEGKATLTDQELAEVKRAVAEIVSTGDPGSRQPTRVRQGTPGRRPRRSRTERAVRQLWVAETERWL